MLFLRNLPKGWSLELKLFDRPNMLSCKVVRGTSRTLVIAAYLPPTTLARLPDLEEALERFLGQDTFLMGDLNVDLDKAQNPFI